MESTNGMEVTAAEGSDGGGTAVAELPPESAMSPSDSATALNTAVPPLAILSEMERRYLARRPQVVKALDNVRIAKEELAAAIRVADDAKKSQKGKEAALEAAWNALEKAETEETPPEQMPLFGDNGSSSPGETPADVDFAKAWDQKWESFLDRPVADLSPIMVDGTDFTASILESLTKAEIDTLRKLYKVKEDHPNIGYRAINKIGEDRADAIDNASERLLAEFLSENPRPHNLEPAPAVSDNGTPVQAPDTNISYDFISTFPNPINPTANEEYADSYHEQCRDEAIDELTELHRLKDLLQRNVGENGKTLTDRTKKTLETKIGEVQLHYDESFDMYGEKFGKSAAGGLRRYVEEHVEKKANLKGGLE